MSFASVRSLGPITASYTLTQAIDTTPFPAIIVK
nr:MAG TPA: hypothetical protein [Caudoviricetes sp.]